MSTRIDPYAVTPLGEAARKIYETRLRSRLEAEHPGESVAIHVDSGDYAIGKTHREAASRLLDRIPADGRIVTMTVGPPTESDLSLASRILSNKLP